MQSSSWARTPHRHHRRFVLGFPYIQNIPLTKRYTNNFCVYTHKSTITYHKQTLTKKSSLSLLPCFFCFYIFCVIFDSRNCCYEFHWETLMIGAVPSFRGSVDFSTLMWSFHGRGTRSRNCSLLFFYVTFPCQLYHVLLSFV